MQGLSFRGQLMSSAATGKQVTGGGAAPIIPPGDGLTAPTPMYGYAKLRTAYAGNAGTWTRASDSATRNVAPTADGKISAGDLAWLSGTTARWTTVNDQSGGTATMTATGTVAPAVAVDAANFVSMRFDGSQSLATTGGVVAIGNNDLSVTMVAKLDATTQNRVILIVSANGQTADFDNSSSIYALENQPSSINTYYFFEGSSGTTNANFGSARPLTLSVFQLHIGVGAAGFMHRINGASGPVSGSLITSTQAADYLFGASKNDIAGGMLQGNVYAFYGTYDTTVAGLLTKFETFASRTYGISLGAAAPPVSGPTATYDYTAWAKPLIGGPVTGVVFAPAVLQKVTADDIIGFNFNAPTGQALATRRGTFAHYFPAGLVAGSQQFDTFYSGSAKGVQRDVLRLHPDGTIAHCQFTMQYPALAAGQTIQAMLRRAAAAPTGANVDSFPIAQSNMTASVTVVNKRARGSAGAATTVGVTHNLNPGVLLAADVTPSYWQQGPYATQRRFIKRLSDALRVVLDATAYDDGNVQLEYEVLADEQFYTDASVTSWTLDTTIAQGGANVFSDLGRRLFFTYGFKKSVYSGDTATVNSSSNPPVHNIQFDMPFLVQTGAVPHYALDFGVNESLLASFPVTDVNFRKPNTMFGIQSPNMGGTGGRVDIAILTEPAAAFFQSGDARARQFMIAQGEMARHLPINHYDPNKNVQFNLFPTIGYPNIWIDGSDNRGAGSMPANYRVPDTVAVTGRDWDGAHQPMLAYGAYLITGNRMMADALAQQAAFTSAGTWNSPRTRTVDGVTKDWVVIQENQPRQAGWAMRDVAMAAFLLPDSSPLKVPLFDMVVFNYKYVLSQVAAWKTAQGEYFGWLPYSNPYDAGVKPWMNDHFFAGTYCAWLAGCQEAYTFVDTFVKNFVIGRGNQADAVFPYQKGAHFLYRISNGHDILASQPTQRTWSALSGVAEAGVDANGWIVGNFPQLWLRSLSLARMMLKDTTATAIITRILGTGAPQFTSPPDYRAGPQDAIRPLTLL